MASQKIQKHEGQDGKRHPLRRQIADILIAKGQTEPVGVGPGSGIFAVEPARVVVLLVASAVGQTG